MSPIIKKITFTEFVMIVLVHVLPIKMPTFEKKLQSL